MAKDDSSMRASRSATMSNLTSSLKDAEASTGKIASNTEKAFSNIDRMAQKMRGLFGGGGQNTGGSFFGGGGGGSPMMSGTFGYGSAGAGAIGNPASQGTMLQDTTQYKYTGFANALPSFFGAAKGLGTALAGAAFLAAPSIPDALQLNLLANRQQFYGGTGGIAGGFATSALLAQRGTPTNAMDAAFAANNAMAYGFMPSNQGAYGNALGGAALISNLRPGIGLQGGMQAVGALNQARTVNMLRMIGINVRSNDGTGMRSVEDIVEYLWKILTNANNGKPPTKEDISISAMSGNALDSILNQYFSGDENLRFAVLTALIQRASGKGLSIGELEATGATTRALRSVSAMNASLLASKQLLSAPILQGMMGANRFGTKLLDLFTGAATKPGIGAGVMKGLGLLGFTESVAGLGEGAGSLVMAGLGNAIGQGFKGLSTLVPAFEGGAVPEALSAIGPALAVGAAGLTSGAFANVNPAGDVNFNPAKGANISATPSTLTINVNMSGDYQTGVEAGNTIASAIISAMKKA